MRFYVQGFQHILSDMIMFVDLTWSQVKPSQVERLYPNYSTHGLEQSAVSDLDLWCNSCLWPFFDLCSFSREARRACSLRHTGFQQE